MALSEHQVKRYQLQGIVMRSGVYVPSERAPSTWVGAHVDTAARITLQLAGNNVKVWKGNFKARSMLMRDIDPVLFETYILEILGYVADSVPKDDIPEEIDPIEAEAAELLS